jgi:MtN3 and saliva related transmembrane protein
MEYAEIIGLAAGFFATIGYIPQAIKAYKTKSTRDLSLLWLALTFVGIALWAVYGFIINSIPVLFWNIITEALVVSLIALKLKHG